MNTIFNKLITAFWIFDIMNLPFMEMFDTTYPINFWEWFLLFALWGLLPATVATIGNTKKDG